MTEWWTAAQAGLIGGILGGGLGSIAGIYGAAAGICAPRGIARAAVLGAHVVLLCLGGALLVGAGVAALTGQPWHVFYPVLLTGLILTLVLGPLLPVIRLRYREAEARRLDAAAIRRS